MFNIIVSQGRVGDRSCRTLEGAALTAKAMHARYHRQPLTVGDPAPPARDQWTDSLSQAGKTLCALRNAVETSIDAGAMPIIIANTCSVSLATLPVVARRYPEAAVLWVDAHGDFNTPATTGTGYLGGMVLAAACGLWDSGHGSGLDPRKIIVLGARDIDPAETDLLAGAGVRLVSAPDVTAEAVLSAISGAPVWIHVDWDAMEPGHIPADYQVPDGILPGQLRAVLEAIPPSRLLGLEIAEFHPGEDEAANGRAVATILEIIAPALDAKSPSSPQRDG